MASLEGSEQTPYPCPFHPTQLDMMQQAGSAKFHNSVAEMYIN
jgi:hypothetical protein